MEAVKQGSAAVGLRSNEYAVILGLKVHLRKNFYTFIFIIIYIKDKQP